MVNLYLQSRTTPDDHGYGDTLILESDLHLKFACPCSCCPNPRKPLIKGGAHWKGVYDWIAEGIYDYECVNHGRYGKCLSINGHGEVASRSPVANSDGSIFTRVYVHKGYTMDWRGSAGCPTIRPDAWSCFQSFFEVGDHGKIVIAGRLCECKI